MWWWLVGREGGRAVSKAIYILLVRCSAKERSMKQARANTCVRRTKQVGHPAAPAGQPVVGQSCAHVEAGHKGARQREGEAQREGNHNNNNKHVAPPCDATQDLLVVREGGLSSVRAWTRSCNPRGRRRS